MNDKLIDKVMKSYWESKFGSLSLEKYHECGDSWNAFIDHGNDVHIIIGCPVHDIKKGFWFYYSGYFEGGEDLFNLNKFDFLESMREYLNKTYGLNIKRIY